MRAMTFDYWMRVVDRRLIELCGMDSMELPDYDYARAYESGALPNPVAMRAYKAAATY